MEGLGDKLVIWVINIALAIAIFVIGKIIAKFLSSSLEKVLIKGKTDQALAKFARSLSYVAMMIFVIIAAIAKVGIQTTSFIAVLGAAGLAVGMALQGSLSNFAAGVMILIFKPFSIGDFVNAGGVAGTVQEIQIFNTVLHTPDNIKIIIPNAQITSGPINNYSANDTRRVDMVFGVGYGDDLNKATQVITDTINADSRILKDPAPTIAVSELADSSVNFVVRPWVNSADYWGVYFDLQKALKEALDQNGLNIPYPQRDIHIIGGEQTSPAATSGVASN